MFNISYNKKNGFALVGILVAVFIVAAIIFGSSFFWKNDRVPSAQNSLDTLQGAKDDLAQVNENTRQQNQALNSVLGEDEKIITGAGVIKVFALTPNAELTSPVTITGEGSAASNELVLELRNSEHQALVTETVTIKTSAPGQGGPFEITLYFQFNNTRAGYLALYEKSQTDNRAVNLLEIPVKFTSPEAAE